jgi:hypothetical protein
MVTFFCAGIVFILASIGGKEGLSSLLAADSPARATAIYLFLAGGFSLTVSLLLFSPAALSQFQRLGLLILGAIQMLTGAFFASSSVVVTVFPLWFLFRFYREASA